MFLPAPPQVQALPGFFYGANLVLALYLLTLYVVLRDRAHLYAVLYAAFLGLALAISDGVGFDSAAGGKSEPPLAAATALLAAALVCGALLAREFLAPGKPGAQRPAQIFALACFLLFAFVAIWALQLFHVLPANTVTAYGLHIAVVANVLLLAVALEGRGAGRTAELSRANERLRAEARHRDELIEQLREQEKTLRFEAEHDPLTGLANRHTMLQVLAHRMQIAKRNRKKLAVMMVDFDDFKRINDTHGHATGDRALAAMAERLRASVRASDTVSRYGGDEFVVVAGDFDHAEDVGTIADKVAELVSAPLPVDGGSENIACSIGISIYPDDAEEGVRLIDLADRAMYAAKKRRGARIAYYAATGRT